MDSNFRFKKSVILGDRFIEHRFDKFKENFVGSWIKCGHFTPINASNESLICDSCIWDQDRRNRNWMENSDPDVRKLHSYQVPGVTCSKDYYAWSIGKCYQDTTLTCWGRKQRIFQVKRIDDSYLYSSYISYPYSREELGRSVIVTDCLLFLTRLKLSLGSTYV